MPRNFSLSGIGLGLYLLGLGLAYILSQTSGLNGITFWFHLYPLLLILLGLDYILANFRRIPGIFRQPSGLILVVIFIITIIGFSISLTPQFAGNDWQRFRSDILPHPPLGWIRGRQLTVQENFKLPAGVATVQIDNKFGNISVDNIPGDTIIARAHFRLPFIRPKVNFTKAFKLAGEVQGDLFIISVIKPETLIWPDKRPLNVNIAVQVPKGVAVRIENSSGNVKVGTVEHNLTIEMVSGNIQVQNVGQTLTVHHEFGNINIGRVQGQVNITAQAGQISIGEIGGGTNIKSSFGDITIAECHGPLAVKIRAGNLSANLAKITANCDLIDEMGNMKIALPAEAQFTLEANSMMGQIASDFAVPIRKETVSSSTTGTVNGGGPLLKIQVRAGNIKVAKL